MVNTVIHVKVVLTYIFETVIKDAQNIPSHHVVPIINILGSIRKN